MIKDIKTKILIQNLIRVFEAKLSNLETQAVKDKKTIEDMSNTVSQLLERCAKAEGVIGHFNEKFEASEQLAKEAREIASSIKMRLNDQDQYFQEALRVYEQTAKP